MTDDTGVVKTCGNSDLLARSYTLRPRWPFDAFRLVMEFASGTCDLYRKPRPGSPTFCCQITGDFHEPEKAVREAIASFLIGCERRPAGRPCNALDLGANNGWFSAYMLQLGAHVVSVEPQPDFARAIKETAKLNCWSAYSTVINARACPSSDVACMRPTNASTCHVGGWRQGGGSSQLKTVYGIRCAEMHGLPSTVRGVALASILLGTSKRAVWDLVKIDVDGPEGSWLQEIDALISAGKLIIRNIIVEASFVRPSQMRRLQHKHGYTAYRLDAHDSRRHMMRTGWDGFSPKGTIASLERFEAQHKEADTALTRFSPHNARYGASDHGPKPAGDGVSRLHLEEELFSVRAMRHVFRARPNLSLQAWTTLMQPMQHDGYESAPMQWALTLDGDLTEPTRPGADWRHVSPEYAAAKASGHLHDGVDAEYDELAHPSKA